MTDLGVLIYLIYPVAFALAGITILTAVAGVGAAVVVYLKGKVKI